MTEKTCFIIAPVGEKGSSTRKRTDQVQRHVVEPAVTSLGYAAPARADQLDQPGMITNQIVEHLVNDDLVVADLTDLNANVFYELAVRHATRKPIVHLVSRRDLPKLPFDVKQVRAIPFDHRDLDSAAEAREAIIAQVGHMEDDPGEIENPISHAMDILAMKRSDDTVQQTLGELRSTIDGLRSDVGALTRSTSWIPLPSTTMVNPAGTVWQPLNPGNVVWPTSGPPAAFTTQGSDFPGDPEDYEEAGVPESDYEPDVDDIGD